MENRRRADCLVIVPTLNPGLIISSVLTELQKEFCEVVVIDDGSSNSVEETLRRKVRYCLRHSINQGQGAAISTGFKFFLRCNRWKSCITFDSDGQHRVEDAIKLYETYNSSKYQAVLGSRFLSSEATAKVPLMKLCTLKVGRLVESLLLGIWGTTDSHNGLRLLTVEAVKAIYPIRNLQMSHATEISQKISESGFEFCEIPVIVEYENKASQSPMNAINIIFDYFVQLFR